MYPIPPDIGQFLQANIESMEQLELLRVLSEEPNREWELAALSQAVIAEPAATGSHLAALASRGLVTVVSSGGQTTYRQGCASPALDAMLSRVLEMYKERPVSMIRLVYDQATDRLRAFSDAFRVRKEN